jgi:hypothetical protein
MMPQAKASLLCEWSNVSFISKRIICFITIIMGGAMHCRLIERLRMLSIVMAMASITFVFSSVAIAENDSAGGKTETKAPKEEEKAPTVRREEELDLPKTKRDINGVVVDMLSGEPVADAKVSLLDVTVISGADGRFTIKDVKEYHAIQMTARILTELDIIIGCSYFFIPTNYYPISANKDNKADVQIINMLKDDNEVVLKVAEYAKENIDRFCEKCHEGSPCLVREEYGKIANAKMKLTGMMVRQSELEKYIEDMKKKEMTIERYSKIRYADSHPKNIDITMTKSFEEGRVALPGDMALKEDKIITCDTCHTRHIPTEWGQFAIMDFLQEGAICTECHR